MIMTGHVLISKFVAMHLANVFEELEASEQKQQQQQQQQQQHQRVPHPLLFKSADAASMKDVCLVRMEMR